MAPWLLLSLLLQSPETALEPPKTGFIRSASWVIDRRRGHEGLYLRMDGIGDPKAITLDLRLWTSREPKIASPETAAWLEALETQAAPRLRVSAAPDPCSSQSPKPKTLPWPSAKAPKVHVSLRFESLPKHLRLHLEPEAAKQTPRSQVASRTPSQTLSQMPWRTPWIFLPGKHLVDGLDPSDLAPWTPPGESQQLWVYGLSQDEDRVPDRLSQPLTRELWFPGLFLRDPEATWLTLLSHAYRQSRWPGPVRVYYGHVPKVAKHRLRLGLYFLLQSAKQPAPPIRLSPRLYEGEFAPQIDIQTRLKTQPVCKLSEAKREAAERLRRLRFWNLSRETGIAVERLSAASEAHAKAP